MLRERLLERLRHIEAEPGYRGATDPNQLVTSIMVHLRKILNTRQGSAPIDQGYGMPDFTDLASNFSSETIKDLVRSIKQVITKYEPRLSSVQINAEPIGAQVLELRFKIEGRLTLDNHLEMPVAFETVVDPDGRIKINK
ncbi:MAG: type VI secretion system baseplate subunit TssE [Thermodesulfobacteriota bacterium]